MSRTVKAAAPFYVKEDDAPAKREIMRAALALFVRQGLDGTSIRDIADEAGYTNPALFKHFEGKEALARHLFVQCYLRMDKCLFQGLDLDAPFQKNLGLLAQRATAFLDESLEAFLFVQDNLRTFWPQVGDQLRASSAIARLRALLLAGRKQGVVATDVSLDLQVSAVSGTLSQFARLLYFKEIKGKAGAWAGDLETLMRRMLSG